MGALYQLTSPSGKSYIGITSKTTENRWAKHREHALAATDEARRNHSEGAKRMWARRKQEQHG